MTYSLRFAVTTFALVAQIVQQSVFVSADTISDVDVQTSGCCADDHSLNCRKGERCYNLAEWFNGRNNASAWKARHPSILKAFLKHHINVSVEVGIARGALSYYLLSNIRSLVHHGVDPFKGGYDGADVMSKVLTHHNSSDWAKAVAVHLKQFRCRFRLHMNSSLGAVSDFRHDSVDCVFLDGSHLYKDIVDDITAWMPIVRPGGMLVFDDYMLPPVGSAVDQFVSKNRLKLLSINRFGNVVVIKPARKKLKYIFAKDSTYDKKWKPIEYLMRDLPSFV